eukprot:1318803-Amphidinium_carterae.1
MLKPVFVPQSRRETVKERENREKEEEEAKEKDKENLKKRKLESKEQLLDRIKADDDAEKAADQEDLFASDVELPDDDDEKDEAEEYDLWCSEQETHRDFPTKSMLLGFGWHGTQDLEPESSRSSGYIVGVVPSRPVTPLEFHCAEGVFTLSASHPRLSKAGFAHPQ